jgi:hypothetical protein
VTDDERILRDLGTHMRKKILRVISDHLDLCITAELDPGAVSANLMSFFLGLTATYAAGQFKISPGEFARVALLEFRRAQEKDNEAD